MGVVKGKASESAMVQLGHDKRQRRSEDVVNPSYADVDPAVKH
jgi:hypothetical protein